MGLRLIRRSDSVITAHYVHPAAPSAFGTISGIHHLATAARALPRFSAPRHTACAHSGVRRARPYIEIRAPTQLRPSSRAAKTTKTRETTQSRDAATAASRLPRRPAARHAARARSGVRTARPDAVRLNPAPFRSPRAREKTGGRSREVGCVDRVKILRYVFECPRRSIGWWEVGWKVSSPREELALPRSARRTAPPCPL